MLRGGNIESMRMDWNLLPEDMREKVATSHTLAHWLSKNSYRRNRLMREPVCALPKCGDIP